MKLSEIDLNLLVVFNHLLAERRVSTVAEIMGRSQPAISSALNRLRHLMGDELFVRTSRGMEPTAHALYIAESIAYALGTIESAINEQETFDPLTDTRRFTLGLSDIGEINLLPQFMRRLKTLAPKISISTLRDNTSSLQENMESGHVDIAVGMLPQLKTGYFQRRLFKQRYVCMFKRGHILERASQPLEAFAAAEHLVVAPPESGHAEVNDWIERAGIRRNARLTVPHYAAVGPILAQEDAMIATVPESYARQCQEPFGLSYVEHPLALPEIDVNVFWHAKFHRQPSNKWLRTVMFQTFSATGLLPDETATDGAGHM